MVRHSRGSGNPDCFGEDRFLPPKRTGFRLTLRLAGMTTVGVLHSPSPSAFGASPFSKREFSAFNLEDLQRIAVEHLLHGLHVQAGKSGAGQHVI